MLSLTRTSHQFNSIQNIHFRFGIRMIFLSLCGVCLFLLFLFFARQRKYSLLTLGGVTPVFVRRKVGDGAALFDKTLELISTPDHKLLHKKSHIDILFQFVNAESGGKIANNLRNMLKSIFENTEELLRFHIISDTKSETVAETIFKELSGRIKRYKDVERVYIKLNEVAEKVKATTTLLQKYFSSGYNGDYYGHTLFVLPTTLHRVIPLDIERIIMLDADVKFEVNIRNLYANFKAMTEDHIMALAREQQPTYRHLTYSYRSLHSGTLIGEPPPNGFTGYNSGVKLMNLKAMRNSTLYNSLLESKLLERLTKKYTFKGHLGDQDFFTLISFEYPSLFYTLPCQRNRQLCTWWRDHGYDNIFLSYHHCEPPIFVYHGNCNTPIPDK